MEGYVMEQDLFRDMINRDIKIDLTELPKPVIEIIDELEEIHKERDWLMYDLKSDELEIRAKTFVINKKLKESTYKRLLEKYGGLYD